MKTKEVFLCCLTFALGGVVAACSEKPSPKPAAQKTPANQLQIDTCTLLQQAGLESLFGGPAESLTPSSSAARFTVSSCHFIVPVAKMTVNVTVLQRNLSAESSNVTKRWEEMFPPDKRVDWQRAEGGVKTAAIKVEGLGEEAFWAGNERVGMLHVLKGDHIVSVSLGGERPMEERRELSKKLVEALLQRLP